MVCWLWKMEMCGYSSSRLTGVAQFSGAGTLSLRSATSVGGSAITTALTGSFCKQN